MPELTSLAPQQLLEEAYKLIAKDRARFSGTNYPVYKGENAPPMSTLTQRARNYQEQFARKPAPYSNKINTVLNKSNEALPQANIQELLNNAKQSQAGSNENLLMGFLRNQFNSSYTPQRQAEFRGRGQQDIERGAGELSGRLQDINKSASNLEATRNLQAAKTLQSLQAGKQLRRQGLVSNLEQFGNQKHTHGNKVIDADQARFNQEANEPQKRLQMLTEALEPHRKNFGGNNQMHPDLEKPAAQEILKALRAYGVDTAKPTEQWGSARTEPSRYPGKMVADLTPEMQSSYNLLERISPSYKDAHHAQRKNIVRGLTGNETTASKALRNVPAAMQGKVSQLEEDARQRMQKDLAEINNRYIKLGQYGSEQHMADAERRAQELNKAMINQRNSYLDESLRNQIAMQHEGEIGNIRKLNVLGEAGHKEFGDVLQNVGNLNKLGANKWKNQQDELDQLYKNYQNEQLWEWPHMRNAVRGEAHNEILGNAAARGLGIDELANMRSRYSESQKEVDRLNSLMNAERDKWGVDIKNLQDYYGAQQQERQRAAELQRQADARAAQERAAREAAEKDRLAREAAARNQMQAKIEPVQKDWRQPGNYYLPENILNNILSEHQGRYSRNPAFGDVLNMATQWHQSFGRQNGHAILTPNQLDKFSDSSLNNHRYGDWANQYKQYLYSPAPQNNNVPPQGDGMALREWYKARGLLK